MKVYWREHKSGQRLMVNPEEGEEMEVGAVRRTPRGFDAMAKTLGYDPGRAQKDFPSMEDAKTFVEAFHPWDIYVGNAEIELDSTIYPLPEADA